MIFVRLRLFVLDSPEPLEPQAVTFPSEVSASAWALPAAMATTLVRPLGTLVWLFELLPHASTVLLVSRAPWKLVPEAIATAFVKVAGTDPNVWPHCTTVPSFFKARLC